MAIRITPAGSSVTEAPTVPGTARDGIEWTAGPLRPVAHWVTLPSADGRPRLQMVWEVPNPVASQVMA